MLKNTKGIDVSHHQGKIDWEKVKADGIQFAIIRAGFGNSASQKDEQFDANMQGAHGWGPCGDLLVQLCGGCKGRSERSGSLPFHFKALERQAHPAGFLRLRV